MGTGIVQRLLALDTCAVSDAMDQIGLRGTATGLAPMWNCGRVAGRAQTVKLRRLRPGERPGSGPHLGARAIERAAPGEVVVVDHQGRDDSAGWGGLLSVAAKLAGVAGVIVDGACRDLDESEAAGLPLYARSATPTTARGRTVEEACGVAVELGGAHVRPGDYVIADRSGVVVLPAGSADEVLARAEALADRERALLAALRRGDSVSQVMDQRYETMLDDRSPRRTGAC